MPLPAERELDHALGREIARRQHHLLVAHGLVVDLEAARLDLTPPLAVRGDEAGLLGKGRQHTDALFELGRRDLDGGQAGGERAFLEGLPRRRLGGLRRPPALGQSGGPRGAARPCWAVLISWAAGAASLAISGSGSSVKSLRKRTTSPSSLLRQYCQ